MYGTSEGTFISRGQCMCIHIIASVIIEVNICFEICSYILRENLGNEKHGISESGNKPIYK
jgi:hypothetical protein